MIYGENVDAAKRYKEEYVEGFDRIIIEREAEGAFVRDGFVKKIFADQQGAREEFKKMLGWPLCEDRGTITEPETEKLFEQEEYTIYRMRFEILAGLKLTGLFFKKNDDKERPLIIVQHGGLGSPELMSGFYNGDSSNYNDVSERVLKFDVNIFAPSLYCGTKNIMVLNTRDVRLMRGLRELGVQLPLLKFTVFKKSLIILNKSHM